MKSTLGYSLTKEELYEAVSAWMTQKLGRDFVIDLHIVSPDNAFFWNVYERLNSPVAEAPHST